MFYCNDCGALFKELATIKEVVDDEMGYLEYRGCPHCRSDQIVQAVQCDLCREYVTEDYVILNDGTVACANCHTRY